jgi:hypothetical protein
MRISLKMLRQSIEAGRPAPQAPHLPALQYPLFPAPRIAVLGAALRPETGVHCLPAWTAAQLERLRPMALAGSWNELTTVARLLQAGQLSLPDLRYPLVVFTSSGAGSLSLERHLRLWECFRLPVFEQIRTADGRLLATECESREGFHLADGVEEYELDGALPAAACGCASPRALYRVESVRTLAAAGD